MVIPEKAKAVARQIAEARKCDIYFWNGPVNEDSYGALVQSTKFHHRSAMLVLVTYGGSANSAYRAARYLQTIYDKLTVFVPSYCKSAGTLLAIGAHNLIMSNVAELGPLDVQLYKRDEIGEKRSGLLLRSALSSLHEHTAEVFSTLMLNVKHRSGGLIRFKLASQLAVELATGLMSPIYEQITPEGLGEDYQDLMVAVEYGNRLAKVSGNISNDAIYSLVHNYPSHDFVIDTEEAKTLFKTIEDVDKNLYSLMSELGPIAFVPNPRDVIVESLSYVENAHKTTVEATNETESKANGIDAGAERPAMVPARRRNRRSPAPPN